MFPSLAGAIAELVIPADPRALRTLVALRDRLDAAITMAIGEFDELRLWDTDKASSMKMWLVDEGLAPQDAHRHVQWAKRLRVVPVVGAAWASGDLSNGQVRVIVETVIDRHVAKFQAAEDDLVPCLVGLSVKDTVEVMGEWRRRADALDDERPPDPERSLHHSQTLGGRYIQNGSYDADAGSIIAQALAIADSNDLDVPANRRRADAEVLIHQFFLDHHGTTSPPRQRAHVAMVIDPKDLEAGGRNTETGDLYDAATVSRYLCDCELDRVIADKVGRAVSRVLNLGRSVRTATPAQRIALSIRDGGCRMPGCTIPPAWCEAHHVVWVEHQGPTDMDNLVLLCGRHHDEVHRKHKWGMHIKLLPDATLEVTYLNGYTRSTRPPGAHDPLPL